MTLFKRYLLNNVYRDKEAEGGTGDDKSGDNKPNDNKPDDKGGDGDPVQARENVFQERIGELTRRRGEAERALAAERTRNEDLTKELEAARALIVAGKGKEGDPPPVERRDTRPVPTLDEILNSPEGKKAVETVAARRAQSQSLSERGDALYDQGAKEFGQEKWDRALGMFKTFDGLREDVTNALLNVENGQKVLFHLGNNPAEIARIYKLADRDPIAMTAEIAKLSVKVTSQSKKVSEAPEPPDNNDTGGGGPVKKDYTDKDLPMADFVAQREADLKRRGVRI